MSEENIHVDTLVTEDMKKDELYDYAKYLEYRKEELLNINSYLAEQLQQKENIINELENYCWELKAMGCREGALDMLDKLKELKEENK